MSAVEDFGPIRGLQMRVEQLEKGAVQPTLSGGGDPPHNNGMDEIERRLTVIETTLPNLATKADVEKVGVVIAEMKSDIFKWGSTIIIAAFGATVAVTAVLLNRIAPPQAQIMQPTQPQPIVIQIPSAPAIAPPPPK